MKYAIEISKIIEGAMKNDKNKIINYADQFVKKLELDGEIRFSKKIDDIIKRNGTTSMMPMGTDFQNDPVDSESRFSMIEIFYPDDFIDDLIITGKVKEQIDMFSKNYKSSDALAQAGLDMANKLLLYGPPGSGKTKTAHHIAKSLNLPLVIGRLDSIISSYLGTTAKNIRTLFEFAESTPCVLLLDEFDAIAKARDDTNELGELKRVVNSLLQNIDILDNNSVLIAATNHEQLLDPAIWRRFDYKILIDYPGALEIGEMIRSFSGDEKISENEVKTLSALFIGKSGSDIELIIKRARRNAIINNKNFSYKLVVNEVLDASQIKEKSMDPKEITRKSVLLLRDVDTKIFTYGLISEILGVSKSTISNIIREDKMK